MESKSVISYKQVFSYIEKNLLELKPKVIHSDYEASLLKALQDIYPSAQRVGCWFHYCQAVRRRLGKGQGQTFFLRLKENRDVYKIYKKLMDLPLLPAKDIPEGFTIIRKEIDEKGQGDWFKHIYAYFETFWLPKVSYLQSKHSGVCKIN